MFYCCENCNLGIKDMDVIFMLKLAKAERLAGFKFNYNSTIRCKKHNKEVGGSETSSHLKGLAVDIKVKGSRKRFLILKALIDVGFTRIGIYKTFLHVDYSKDKIQEVIWYY